MDAHRWSSVEPRVERQFLQVVGVPILSNDGRRIGTSERISNLQIILTAGDLTRVAPRGRWVHIVGIVHPLSCFVGNNRSIVRIQECSKI